jgi:hypothetical protein
MWRAVRQGLPPTGWRTGQTFLFGRRTANKKKSSRLAQILYKEKQFFSGIKVQIQKKNP